MTEDHSSQSTIEVGGFIVGAIATNVYYLHRNGGKDTIVIDAADNGKQINEALNKQGLTVKAVLLTHGHFDHILGLKELKEASNAEVYACEKEEELLNDADENCSNMFGRPCTAKADHYLKDGEKVTVCGITLKCIWTPGHTKGSCCYYIEGHDNDNSHGGTDKEPILFSGDTLFEESVGRTDFPTGSMSELVHSVKDKLYVLPDDTLVYPGHQNTTTIAHEKQYNYSV